MGNRFGNTVKRSAIWMVAGTFLALFVLVVVAGRSFGPESGIPVTGPEVSAPQPSQEFVYFPSQYVNQAMKPPEDTSTF
jgi:hypothetical protein